MQYNKQNKSYTNAINVKDNCYRCGIIKAWIFIVFYIKENNEDDIFKFGKKNFLGFFGFFFDGRTSFSVSLITTSDKNIYF